MKLNYKKVQSSIKPELIDSTSSPTTIYIRQNIIEKEIKNHKANNTYIMYEYEEAKLSKEEYEEYLKEISIADIQQQRADIDYIEFVTGINTEKSYDKVKKYYDTGLWNTKKIQNMIEKNIITSNECKDIIKSKPNKE